MKTILALIAATLVLTGCAGTQAGRQESADQVFGKAKLGLIAATGAVSVYNVLCMGTLSQASVCAPSIRSLVNTALAGAADTISGAERVFAAANSTEGAKLDAAKAAVAIVAELTAALAKYGVARVAG